MPQLAEQWQEELRTKFNIDAELVLASTAARLERSCGLDQSIFDVFPALWCPSTSSNPTAGAKTSSGPAPNSSLSTRRTVAPSVGRGVVDATNAISFSRAGLRPRPAPDSGHGNAAQREGRRLSFPAGLSGTGVAHLPADLAGEENEHHRRRLAAHLVQRRRPDIRSYLDTETPFPEREDKEESYQLSPEYHQLFEHMLRYARETVRVPDENRFRQRVRWWSALALLRSLASSPVAAAATLRNRSAVADAESEEAVEEIGIRSVMDQLDDDPEQAVDTTPGAESGEEFEEARNSRKRRLEMARMADALIGEKDLKLTKAVGLIQSLP